MRKTIILLLVALMATVACAKPLRQVQLQFTDEWGQPVNMTTSASIYVYSPGTTTELSLYLDPAGGTAVTQPITDDSTNTCLSYTQGLMSFWVDAQKVKVSATDGTTSRIIDNLTGSTVSVAWPSYLQQVAETTTKTEFKSNPVTAGIAGGAATGTAGDENVMAIDGVNFEYHIVGTATATAPILVAGGLDIGLDDANNDGIEIGEGITARSNSAFTIGTDAFFLKVTTDIPDVSGTDDFLIGFRTAEAYQADPNDYNNMAAVNVMSGDIQIETIDDNAATTRTDTTDNWADGASKTVAVYVSAAGVVTYTIDGSAPTTTAAFTWDDGDTVVPFIYFRHDTTVAESTVLSLYECGLQ